MYNTMNDYKVYRHITPNKKIYVGITRRSLKERWRNGEGYKSNRYFYRAIKKYGWDNIKHEVLFSGLSREEAEITERSLIEHWDLMNPKHGYNLDSGGNVNKTLSDEARRRMSEAHRGFRHSEEAKKRMSESRKGSKNPMYGKVGTRRGVNLSEETKRKISEAQRGEKNWAYGRKYQHSEETKEKISQARKGKCAGELHPNYGKRLSEETRRKISIAKPKRSVAMIDKNTGQTLRTFPSLVDAERKMGIGNSHICSCCRGKRKTAGGYKWKYI